LNLIKNLHMRLLFTGCSGFLGQAILPLLKKKYEVSTLGSRASMDYTVDLSKEVPVFSTGFDVVLHAAGKAHSTPASHEESEFFFKVNTQGTQNLCKALETNLPKDFIFISTVAVYGAEKGMNIGETHPLEGTTPYALSKIEAEAFLVDWCKKHNINLSILRPPLIAGKNPPGNLGSMIKAIKFGRYFRIENGSAQKSILHANDIALLIPKLIENGGIYNVCDNKHPSFLQLEKVIVKQLKLKQPKSIPLWFAKCIAKVGDIMGPNAPINSIKLKKLTESLTFSNQKARKELNWEPLDVIENFKI
jgi:nucleoside-diphosphate-sugar epimerase